MVGGRTSIRQVESRHFPPNVVAANGGFGDAAFIALDLGLMVIARGIANLDIGGTRLAQDAEIRQAKHKLAPPDLDEFSMQCQWPEGTGWALPAFATGGTSQTTPTIIIAAPGNLTVIQPCSERIEIPPLCINIDEIQNPEQALVALVVTESSAAIALVRPQSFQRITNLPSAPRGARG